MCACMQMSVAYMCVCREWGWEYYCIMAGLLSIENQAVLITAVTSGGKILYATGLWLWRVCSSKQITIVYNLPLTVVPYKNITVAEANWGLGEQQSHNTFYTHESLPRNQRMDIKGIHHYSYSVGFFFPGAVLYHPDCGITTITKRHESTDLCMRQPPPPPPVPLLLTRPLSSYIRMRTSNNSKRLRRIHASWSEKCEAHINVPASRDLNHALTVARMASLIDNGAAREYTQPSRTTRWHTSNLRYRRKWATHRVNSSLAVCLCCKDKCVCVMGNLSSFQLLAEQSGTRTQTRPLSEWLSQSGAGSNKSRVLRICK